MLHLNLSESEHYLLEALKDGFVKVVILLCVLLGLPGVGKTHLKFLLLNEQPSYLQTSTNCAEAPVRIEIRTEHDYKRLEAGGRKLVIHRCLTWWQK